MVQRLRLRLLALLAAVGLVAGITTSFVALSSGVAAAAANSLSVNPGTQSEPVGTQETTDIYGTDVDGSSYINVYEYENGQNVQVVSFPTPTANSNTDNAFVWNPGTAQNDIFTAEIVDYYGQVLASVGFAMAWVAPAPAGCGSSSDTYGTVFAPTLSTTSPSAGSAVTVSTKYDGCANASTTLNIYETPGDYTSGTIGMVNLVQSCSVPQTNAYAQTSCIGSFTAPSAGPYTFEAYLVQYNEAELACSGTVVATWAAAAPPPAISLSASNSSLSAGEPVSLTASVTQEASSGWNTYICETTSPAAQVAAQDDSATYLSGTYSEPNATTDTFIAYMASNLYNCADPSQTPDAGILATSNSVSVTWTSTSTNAPMGITLSASPLSPTTGTATILTATVTGDNSNGSLAWVTQTSENGAATGWTSCPSDSGVSYEACPSGEQPSTVSTVTTASSSNAGSATFIAYLVAPDGNTTQSSSVTVTWSGGEPVAGSSTPMLTANPTSLSTGQATTLTATDYGLPSGDFLEIAMTAMGGPGSSDVVNLTACESDTCSISYTGLYMNASGQLVEDGTEPFVAYVAENTSLQSPTVYVTWSAPAIYHPVGTCSVPANEGPVAQTDASACTLYTPNAPTINLSYPGTVPSNEELTVLYGGGNTGVSCSPGENSCQIVDPRALSSGAAVGPLDLQPALVLADNASSVEATGSDFTLTWESTTCPPGSVYSASYGCSVPIL